MNLIYAFFDKLSQETQTNDDINEINNNVICEEMLCACCLHIFVLSENIKAYEIFTKIYFKLDINQRTKFFKYYQELKNNEKLKDSLVKNKVKILMKGNDIYE